MKIVVLAGGLSSEREVSLSSASLIANSLIRSGHQVAFIDVFFDIETETNLEELFTVEEVNEHIVSNSSPDLEALKASNRRLKEGTLIGERVLELCSIADLVFIGLHGGIGENGQLQAIFEAYNIKYTGSDYVGSLLAMDKDLTKRILRSYNLPTADWTLIDTTKEDIPIDTPFPCYLKPVNGGSSVGVHFISNYESLIEAVKKMKVTEQLLIAERALSGREFSVGILNGKALPVIEIIPSNGFYNYEEKYQKGRAAEVCPANLEEGLTKEVQALALEVHKVLRLGSFSRIDFILTNQSELFCLEANTLPGMTPTSLFPQEAAAIGISFDELCLQIIELSIK